MRTRKRVTVFFFTRTVSFQPASLAAGAMGAETRYGATSGTRWAEVVEPGGLVMAGQGGVGAGLARPSFQAGVGAGNPRLFERCPGGGVEWARWGGGGVGAGGGAGDCPILVGP